MARLTVKVSDKVDREFRAEVSRKYGSEKGRLGKAITEAMELWLEQEKGE